MVKLTRKEQKEKTRAGLVGEAETLFARKGISITTTADIAKSLKVSHGTLFVHFPTREDLVLAVIDNFGKKLSEELNRKLISQNLEELLAAHLQVLSMFEDFYLHLICESQFLSPKVRSIFYSMNSAISYKIFNAAKDRMKNHDLKKMNQAQFFNTWIAILHYNIMNRDLFSDKKPILKHQSKSILNHFLTLIKKEDSHVQ